MAETYCSKTDVQVRAGTDGATLTDAQYTSLINQAEAYLNHVMGKDLISSFSGLDDSVKLILELATSAHAALAAIAYDQKNYPTGHATNLININTRMLNDCLERLRDKDVVAAIEDGY